MSSWITDYLVDIPEVTRDDLSIERFTVSEEAARFHNIQAVFGSEGRYRARLEIVPGTYTRLVRNGVLWMSDTPAEIRANLPAIWKAKGRCLVGGLGLGVVVNAMLGKEEVTHVTVVEIDREIIEVVGEWLYEKHGSDRLTIVCADLLKWKPPKGRYIYDCAWFDIWPTITADNVSDMTLLNRRYAQKAKHKGSWQETPCRKMAAEERKLVRHLVDSGRSKEFDRWSRGVLENPQ